MDDQKPPQISASGMIALALICATVVAIVWILAH